MTTIDVKVVESFYWDKADKTVDILLLDFDKVVCAYNHGNGYVKLFPSVEGLMTYLNGGGTCDGCIDMTVEEYHDDDKFNQILEDNEFG